MMYRNRHDTRKRTVFAVYGALIYESLRLDFDPKSLLCGAFMCKYRDIEPTYADVFAKALLNQDTIRDKVDEYLVNWNFDRLSWISKAIFLVAYSETILVQCVPIEVSINEAIEIAREFVDDNETKYLNAVLNKVLHKALGEEVDDEKIVVDDSDMAQLSDEKIKDIIEEARKEED